MKEVEISVKGLIFYILKCWKSILVGGIVGALVIGGLHSLNEVSTNQDTSDVQAEMNISDSDKDYIDSLYANLNNLRQLNNERRESLIMNIDPRNAYRGDVTYMISVSDAETIGGLIQAYGQFLTSSEFKNFLIEKTELTSFDINETIALSYGHVGYTTTTSSINIKILADNEENAEGIVSAIKDYIVDKRSVLEKNGFEHDLVLIVESISSGNDTDILANQSRISSEIQSRDLAVLDAENGLKGIQKEYYESLASDGDLNSSESLNVLDTQDQKSSPISLKHILLGAFLGFFVICGIHFVIYLIANRVDEEDDIEAIFNTSFLGIVPGKDYGKLLFKLRNIGKRTFDFDESIKLISSRIAMMLQKGNSKKIGIVGCGIRNNTEQIATKLSESLAKYGIETLIVDDPLYSTLSAEKLEKLSDIVILEKVGKTYRSEMWNEKELATKLGINIVGIVLAG